MVRSSRSATRPRTTVSPSCSSASVTGSPLTNVPLRPRDRRGDSDRRARGSARRREMLGSSIVRSHTGARPTTVSPGVSGWRAMTPSRAKSM